MSRKDRGSCLPPDTSLQSAGFKIYSSPSTSKLNSIPMKIASSTPDTCSEENIYSNPSPNIYTNPTPEVKPVDQNEIVR